MDDLEQEFGPLTSSVVMDNTEESAPSPSPQKENVRQLDNDNKALFKPAPDKPASSAHHPSSSSVAAVSTMTDLSERPQPKYIKRFGHRNEPAVTPLISHNLPVKDESEDTSPSSPTSSVDIITEATTTRPSDVRPSADDRLIDTASDTSEVASDHHDTSDDAVAGHGQTSSNTESLDSDPQKQHHHTFDQPHEGSPTMDGGLAEQPGQSPLRSESSEEAEENEDGSNDNYNPTNNKFHTPSSRQTKALSEDDSHSSAAEPSTTHPTLHPTTRLPSHHPRTPFHEQRQPHFPNTSKLAGKLQAWRQQDTDRYNEFIAMVEEQCRLQEDKKRLMTENRELKLEVAHLRSIIEETHQTTPENPSLRNLPRLDSPTGHHPNDSYGGDASNEFDSDLPRPSFDGRSYASGANIPHVRAKWQSKEDKKALRTGTKVDDWHEVSRKKNGGGSTRVNPRLNGPNLGTYNKTSPMRNKKALLHNAEGLRVDAPLGKPKDSLLAKIQSMNSEQRFCHLGLRGQCRDRSCRYRHASEYAFSSDELVALRVFCRRLPCPEKTSCSDAGCIFGHICPNGADCFKGSKCAWAATHNIDRRPVPNADNAEELISTAEG